MSRLAAWLMKCRSPRSLTAARPRLGFVMLEDRITPANFIVSSVADSGANTLRAAVIAANGAAGFDTITFTGAAVGGTITLTSGELAVSEYLDITNGGQPQVTISGNNNSRIFNTSSNPGTGVGLSALRNLRLINGKGVDGGAITIDNESLLLEDCVIANSSASDDGGAINVQGNTGVGLIRSTLSGNTAGQDGGGIYFFQDGSVYLRDSSIVNNKATTGTGGGIYFFGTVGANGFFLRNSTISGNSSAGAGGGIVLHSFTGTANILNSTIVNNISSSVGGGITRPSGTGTIDIDSSIVSNNVGSPTQDISSTGTVNVDFSAIGSIAGFTLTGGNNKIAQSLELAPLVQAGNLFVHVPAATSPVKDNGSNINGLSKDATGFPRTLNTLTDIGAIEILSTVVRNTNDSGKDSLRQMVLDSNATPGLDNVTFDSSVFNTAKTITLTSDELPITGFVNITGPAQPLTISGGGSKRIFNINIPSAAGSVILENMTLTNASANGSGGAILVADDQVTLKSVAITNSKASGAGGGVFISLAGTLTLSKSSISGNSASGNGGGIYLFQDNSLSMTASAIVNNKTGNTGGGIYFFGIASKFEIEASTISGNTAQSGGGGIELRSFSAPNYAYIRRSTIVNNSVVSGSGGAINHGGTTATKLNIYSSILSGNTATTNSTISGQAVLNIRAAYTALAATTGGFTFSDIAENLLNLPHANLKLRTLANNGGPTFTHAIEFDSPLRNEGFLASMTDTDQRGFTAADAIFDIGAFELNTRVMNANDTGAGSLRAAVEESNRVVGADTVTFDPTFFSSAKTITLASTLSISDAVTITGPGAKLATVSGNSLVQIFNTYAAPAAAAITISGLTLANGKASGGAAVAFADEVVTIRDSILTGNSAIGSGGAIIGNGNPGSLLIERSTLSGNSAGGSGGAIILNSGVGLTIRNATLANNTSNSNGGAIRFSDGSLLVQNATIVGNSASFGGGIFSTANFSIESSIISGNTATNADISAVTVNSKNSAIGSSAGFTFNDQGGNLAFGTNLKLGTLANNGGPTNTILPAGDSPLVGKGSNPAALATDQRGVGFPRVVGPAVDIGAVETTFVFSLVVSNADDSGPGSLRQAILSANSQVGNDTITFDPAFFSTAKTITLATQLDMTDAGTITGPGVGLLTVSGGNTTRVLNINNGNAAVIAVTITDLTVANGFISGFDGGGIVVGGENLTLERVAVLNSKARRGGGIYTGYNGALTLRNATISGNSSSLVGGGVFVDVGTALTIRDSRLTGNTGSQGGGFYARYSGAILVESSTLSGNSVSSNGGGLRIQGASSSGTIIRNTTIANNTSVDGGGIRIQVLGAGAAVTVQNSTITGNVATSTSVTPGAGGGGLSVSASTGGVINIESTVVSGNTASVANGRSDIAAVSGPTINVNFSAIGDADGFTFAGANNLPFGTNLKLRALANNGGPTNTIAFEHDSPLRNVGSNPVALTVDQRGINRNNGGVDIGAFELNTLVINTNDGAGGSLRNAVEESNRVVGTDTITFDSSFSTAKTITLASTLSISDAVTINGPGARLTTVSGNSLVQIINTYAAPVAAAITISGLTLTNGKSVQGGALGFISATIAIRDSALVNNTSTGGAGAIVGLAASGSLLIERSTLSGNSSTGNGGAIFVNPGINVTVRNTTIASNTSGGDGGAIRSNSGTLLVQNSTIVGNSATFGGGIVASASFSIESSVVSGNTGAAVPDISASTVNAKNSAIGSSAGFTFNNQGGNLPFQPHANLKLSLAFVNNGGPVNTIGFAFDSPLRSAGSNPAGLATDARGFVRVSGAATDIGALEMQETVFNTNDAGSGSLREAILDSNRFTATNTIIFDPTAFATAKTILLSSELNATDAVTIIGPPTVGVTVSGKADLFELFRVLNVESAPASSIFTLSDLTITKGRPASPGNGGGINAGAQTLNLTNVTVSSSVAQSNGGGIFFSTGGGTLNLTRSTINNNVASSGGGIHFTLGGSVNILDSSIIANSANNDGGGLLVDGAAPVFNIRNSTFSGNSANSDGGGIYLNNFNSTALIRNTTITGNTARFGSGGGIKRLGTGTLTIDSTIVSGNTAANGFDIVAASTVNVNFSAIGNSIGFTLTGANNLAFGTNLKLGALANNGGPTLTHLPASDSPLLNKGSNVSALTTDQRGLARVDGASADIGSVELQTAAAATGFTVNNGNAQRSRITTITVNFSGAVLAANFNTLGAITLTRTKVSSIPTGVVNDVVQTGPAALGHITVTQGTSTSLILTFDNNGSFTSAGTRVEFGSLTDGFWRLAVGAFQSALNDLALRRLFGDSTVLAGGVVDGADSIAFGNAFNTPAVPFDFNNDGTVDGNDLNVFGNRFSNAL